MTDKLIITKEKIEQITYFLRTHQHELANVEVDEKSKLIDSLQSLPMVDSEPVANWRCYHCNEVFTSHDSASDHFGRNEYSYPICKINGKQYREMEEQVRRSNEQDSETDRQMAGIQVRHQSELRREEELGYARGLRDAKTYIQEDLSIARAVCRSSGISLVSRNFIERFADFVMDWKKGDFTLPQYAEIDMQSCFDAWQAFDPDLATSPQALTPITADDVTDEMMDAYLKARHSFKDHKIVIVTAYNAVIKHKNRSEAR